MATFKPGFEITFKQKELAPQLQWLTHIFVHDRLIYDHSDIARRRLITRIQNGVFQTGASHISEME